MGFFNFKRNKQEKRTLQDLPQSTEEKSCGATLSNKIFNKFTPSGINLAAVFNAVNLISNSCAILPWKATNENQELLKNTHYLNHLFDDVPVSKFLAVKGVIQDVLMKGNGFMYIERNEETGKPISLLYLPADSVSMMYTQDRRNLYYFCNLLTNKYIPTINILHFKMFSKDGLVGIGISAFAHNTIETSEYTESNVKKIMADGGTVTGILTPNSTVAAGVPTTKKQVDEIRRHWDEARSEHGSSTIILPADLKFTQLSASAKETALVDIRNYNLLDIARYFNISPILLGDLSHNSYGTIEDSQLEFLYHTLTPYIVMMEEELNSKLIMPSKKGYEYIDMDETQIVAADKTKQATYLTTLVSKGIMTVNEARKILSLPKVDNGDELMVAYSNTQQNKINNEDTEETTSTTTQIDEGKEDEE